MGRTTENSTTPPIAGATVGPSLAILSAILLLWGPNPWVCIVPAVLAIVSTLWYRRRALSRSAIPDTTNLIAFGIAVIVIVMRVPAALDFLTRI